MHPASLPMDDLLRQCEFRRQRRSGPGGQHRNKVETGVFVRHIPTGVEGAATERRRQSDNRLAAIERLRVKLAIHVRGEVSQTDDAWPLPPPLPSDRWRSRCRGGRIVVSRDHEDFAALLAEALDRLHECQYHFPPAAERLGCSRSQITRLIAMEPAAIAWVNRQRQLRGLHDISAG